MSYKGQYIDFDEKNMVVKAMLFATFLVAVFLVSVVTALMSTGPIVLGSEMNTNGFVEYLCLGRNCDNIF